MNELQIIFRHWLTQDVDEQNRVFNFKSWGADYVCKLYSVLNLVVKQLAISTIVAVINVFLFDTEAGCR